MQMSQNVKYLIYITLSPEATDMLSVLTLQSENDPKTTECH